MLRTILTDDGVTIAYHDLGPRRGRPVALCHGLAANSRQFKADAAHFAGRGFRVVVPDLRGHGRSGRPQDLDPAHYTIRRMADDMVAVLDDAGIAGINWAGNSLGGIVALDMVGRVPERFASLVTFGTAYSLNLPPLVSPIFPLIYRLFGKGIVSGVTARATTDEPGGRRLVAEMLKAFDPHVGQAVAENVRRYDLIAAALSYRGPMLMIRGGRDRGINAALGPTLRAMEGRANFRRHDLREAAHCANLDLPEVVREVLAQFWQQTAMEQAAA
jgi:pimeloyl-ACP methyl ester carboxylesterase